MVLYPVDKLRGMFQTHSDSYSLGLNVYLRFGKILVDIARAVPGGKDYRTTKLLYGATDEVESLNANHPFSSTGSCLLHHQAHHPCLEMHLSPTLYDCVADVFNHSWQPVGTYMRMRIGKNGCGSTVLAEHTKYLFHTATLLAASIKLTIRVCSGTSLAEAIVAVAIHSLLSRHLRKVFLTLMDILSAFENDRAQSQFNEFQCRKKATWTSPNHNYIASVAHVGVANMLILIFLGLLVYVDFHLQIDEYLPLTSIYRALQHSDMSHCAHVKALILGEPSSNILIAVSLLRSQPDLIFSDHCS